MERALEYLVAHREEHLERLIDYLRIPTISGDATNGPVMARGADFTAAWLRSAGLEEVNIHQTPGFPLVTAAWRRAAGQPTVLIYGHYDVQPVDPLSEWHQDPFQPHIRDGRLIARGATDDKGQIAMHMLGVESILRTRGSLPVNVVFLIDGEEEMGSPNLLPFLKDHRELLRADLGLVSDSSMWDLGKPAITVGLRGLVTLEMTLTGPNRDLHSGTFGGTVDNPLEVMARLLASVKGSDGRVRIPGFYDAVRELTPEERRDLEAIPLNEADFYADLGVSQGFGEIDRPLLERVWCRPTFEINGLWGGYNSAGFKTVLPSQAHAKFSMRLVPDQDPEAIIAAAIRFFTEAAPPTVNLSIRALPGGGSGIVVPSELPAIAAARQALTEAFHTPPLLIREGGSIPVVAQMRQFLGIHTLLIGFGLPDARTHSPNENLHLPTFWSGTEALVRILHHLAS
ncbi:MAG: dipeptidase [Magnetococcales bacterium]|nr:dipeptidase [Magnetococcales bacterium]MBF0155794.1 dipeptidase [Magnetococcales bacterium]